MNKQAFRILGIAPTNDGRAIRAAFLRLAKIYHPDRFVDQPEDVREEAERRMKEATTAYESLRSEARVKQTPDEELDEQEVFRRAVKYREMAAKKRETDEQDEERWRRWARVEEAARKRAKHEADVAARVAEEVDGAPTSTGHVTPAPDPTPAQTQRRITKDPLGERLDAVRRGETAPLVPRK